LGGEKGNKRKGVLTNTAGTVWGGRATMALLKGEGEINRRIIAYRRKGRKVGTQKLAGDRKNPEGRGCRKRGT